MRRLLLVVSCASCLLGFVMKTASAQDSSTGKAAETKLSLPVHHISISVENVDVMTKWYEEKLGFSLDRRMSPGGTEMVWLNAPNLSIHFAHQPGSSRKVPPGNTVAETIANQGLNALVFTVTDFNQAYQRLKENGVVFITQPPAQPAAQPAAATGAAQGNIKLAYFRDPEGNLLGIAQDLPPQK